MLTYYNILCFTEQIVPALKSASSSFDTAVDSNTLRA